MNPEELSGYLSASAGTAATSNSIGQTAMFIFLSSLFIAFISSFGGNSMEMTWNLMNALQLLFFLSYIYLNFPNHLNEFFVFLKYANAENQYLSAFTFMIIPEDHFKRGSVSFFL